MTDATYRAGTSPPVASQALRRPFLRGYSHLGAALAAPFLLVVLLLIAGSPRSYVGAAIFGTSLIMLYAASAAYHVFDWGPVMRGVMKRIDHSTIFLLIAGTYTPFCLKVLSDAWGIPMLAVVWSLAAMGVIVKVVWLSAPRWVALALYLAVGWLGIIPAVQVVQSLPLLAVVLLIAGGQLYTLGGVVYALGRPDPFPRVFGYHEIFHLMVIAGSAVHYAIVAIYVL